MDVRRPAALSEAQTFRSHGARRCSRWCSTTNFPPTKAVKVRLPAEQNRTNLNGTSPIFAVVPSGVAHGFSHVGIVSSEATYRRIFSGISRFPRPYITALLHIPLTSPASSLETPIFKTAQYFFSPLSPPPLRLARIMDRGEKKIPGSELCTVAWSSPGVPHCGCLRRPPWAERAAPSRNYARGRVYVCVCARARALSLAKGCALIKHATKWLPRQMKKRRRALRRVSRREEGVLRHSAELAVLFCDGWSRRANVVFKAPEGRAETVSSQDHNPSGDFLQSEDVPSSCVETSHRCNPLVSLSELSRATLATLDLFGALITGRCNSAATASDCNSSRLFFQNNRRCNCEGRVLHARPPSKANRAQSPAGSPDFRKWESCPDDAVGRRGLLGDLPFPPVPSFRRRSTFTSIALIGSQDLAVKSRPNLFTHSFDLLPFEARSFFDLGGHGRVVARALTSHKGEPGSIPIAVAPGFSHVGIMPNDVADRRGFLRDIPFPPVLTFLRFSVLTSLCPHRLSAIPHHYTPQDRDVRGGAEYVYSRMLCCGDNCCGGRQFCEWPTTWRGWARGCSQRTESPEGGGGAWLRVRVTNPGAVIDVGLEPIDWRHLALTLPLQTLQPTLVGATTPCM
ncbi:hypothetical protein PR048_000208 [Dryococelus australis]|uniref:Uncharacterized protein n=1 Tax=Dryococelus australis TaxID=614101 RepID=A0ABQ9IE62_9NEOP|nr:hypothetical protein PR048_000208 [Dryococelus australis]